mmetsp:Transcript_78511/g.163106  ORF Transcript_78511/g.163106 Transcript_78511/m.163106 type:complete len:690 (+) Transcript_78511:48-2117(+)
MGDTKKSVDGDRSQIRQKLFIFIVYTQVVQALMSYDGGATQFCTSSLADAGWSPLWLGFLGAMDKFGQVATAFLWGGVLMRHDTKPLLVAGLFWKAACCFIFGKLQEQPVTVVTQVAMLSAKLGMGITEALISVWATVWVQRNAPADARARWLGFAGTSAGIGNGVGSGMASLWNPIYAFFFQAFVLFLIWVSLLLTPAKHFRFSSVHAGNGYLATISESEDDYDGGLISQPQFGSQLLIQQVGRELADLQTTRISLESVALKGYYLDVSDEPRDQGFKVRLTNADRLNGEWAWFNMVRDAFESSITTFESCRLTNHLLHFGGELGRRDSRRKVLVVEPAEGAVYSQLTASHFRLHPVDADGGLYTIESQQLPGFFLIATGERLNRGTLVAFSQEDPLAGDRGVFKMEDIRGHEVHPVIPFHEAPTVSKLSSLLQNNLWLFTAWVISLNCFVTSGISFLWQNTIQNVWDFGNAGSYFLFTLSTGIGGLIGVIIGPKIFDEHHGGFESPRGKETCLLTAKRMTFVAAVSGTICTLLLIFKSADLVYSNKASVVYWQLGLLVLCIFLIFFCINGITGALYGINTESVSEEARTFAAGLTVSWQNVFGFAFGPLLPSAVAEIVGNSVQDYWPMWHWNQAAIDGAKYAAGMSYALACTWLLFFFAWKAAVYARVARATRSGYLEPLTPANQAA